MTFEEVLAQVQELLQREHRVSYRGLKRRFALDDEYLEDLKEELIGAKRLATDEDGRFLVWTGNNSLASSVRRLASEGQERSPLLQTLDPRLQTLDSPRGAREGERRQLTVQFIDLVGSTTLSQQLDPEELRTVIQTYRETCATVIRRFDGHLAKYIGDGLLVYFGYPQAHEDDAQRAVRAGLDIVGAMPQLNARLQSIIGTHRGAPLQVRLGIHTGLVVAGEMGVGDQPEPLGIVGETPNIAARLQEKAEPNSVVISPTTYRLVTGLFECQELGPQTLKGISTPLVVYRVVREGEAQSRFEVAVQRGLTPLVGRVEELALLRQHWERAKAGEGRVVLLSGEPGIGKSRLVQEFKAQLGHEGVTRIEFRCSPYYQNSALYPIIDHLQDLLQFARNDSPATKLEKLQHRLSRYRFPQAETVPLLAGLLSLPHPDGSLPITGSPQKQKEKLQAALVAWLIEEAEQNTVYTVWEDLHWADPSTLEVLNLVIDQAPTARLYVLLTFRPEFTPPWGNRSHLSQLTLSRLGRQHVEAMVEKVAENKALPREVLQQIVTKTDGVPLFVEELTKTVVESGLLTALDDRYELTGPLPPLAIPSTLQDSLMARLDRLASVREIVQLGATLGREFSYELLHAVSPLDEQTLQQGLKQLVEAELVYQRRLLPQAQYLFKHALVQDVAYQSLLKSRRQQLHQQIAQVLEDKFSETKATQPELLAHHYTEAGLIAQAVPYWRQAGQRAIARSAHVEAIRHLTTGLELLKALPDTPERTRQELTLQITLGLTLAITRGWAAPEAEHAYTRARELCRQVGEAPQLFPVLWGLWAFYHVRAELKTAHELGEQLLRLAESVHDPVLCLQAHFALGDTLNLCGEFAPARFHLEQTVALYDPEQHQSLALLYGQDPGVASRGYAALALWLLGYPAQALKTLHDALTLAHKRAHPYSLAFALTLTTLLHQLRREEHATRERAEAAIALCTEQGFPLFLHIVATLRGWAQAKQGQRIEGVPQVRQGLAAHRASGAELGRPHWLALLAEAYEGIGQVEEGLNALTEALTLVEKNGERLYEAELYRLRGELTLAQSSVQSLESGVQKNQKLENTDPRPLSPDPQGEAEACFLNAIEIAQKQQAKSWELRAVTSLARLWQQQGKQGEAHDLLAEIYGWFTEGFDTKDLQEAKALLAELT